MLETVSHFESRTSGQVLGVADLSGLQEAVSWETAVLVDEHGIYVARGTHGGGVGGIQGGGEGSHQRQEAFRQRCQALCSNFLLTLLVSFLC